MDTLDALRARHATETTALLRTALERAGWRQADAARDLGVSRAALWQLIRSRPELAAEVAEHGYGPGRPPGWSALLRAALERSGWSQTDAANALGLSPSALWQLIRARPELAEIAAEHGIGPVGSADEKR
jgi:transcriptional regulator with XRE-family HTH domain